MPNIKNLRKYEHLTQAEFAKILNVSRTTVTMWETEDRAPDYDTLKKITNKFAISADYVIGTGVFKNWGTILDRREDVYNELRKYIPANYEETGEDVFLIARLNKMMFYDFDEIALARWFGYAVKSVVFPPQGAAPLLTFTPEFASLIRSYNAIQDSILRTSVPVLGSIPAGIPLEAIEDIVDYEEIPSKMTTGGREYFALIVKGDSMWPVFLPGDVVIVRKSTTCDSGDICVVFVNSDDATLKQVIRNSDGSLTLQPKNPSYPPKTFDAETISNLPVTIAGVVVELRRKVK